MLQRQHRFDEALAEARQAVVLGPSNPAAHDVLIENLIYAGEAEEALTRLHESIRLDPYLPGERYFLKGMAYYTLGYLEEAVAIIVRARRHNPKQTRYAAIQAAALAELGRVEEAKAALEDYLSGWTTYSALTGEQIKALLSNKTMIGTDRSYFGVGHGDVLEVTRGENAQIVRQGHLNYFRDGEKTRIENDLLCDPWRDLGDYCVAIYHNPTGAPDTNDEYLFYTLMSTFSFSVVDSAS
jgi:tetratricopeptide (TPR) repeat protein